MTEHYYRYEDSSCSTDSVHVFEHKLPVVRRTPCGAWVDDYGRERFVLNGAGKRYAYPTREAAWESFLIRKRRRVVHLYNQLSVAERVNDLVKDLSLEDAQAKNFLLGEDADLMSFGFTL